MMNCTVKVMAQYFENYSDTKTPYWKPKGGQEFQIVIDSVEPFAFVCLSVLLL